MVSVNNKKIHVKNFNHIFNQEVITSVYEESYAHPKFEIESVAEKGDEYCMSSFINLIVKVLNLRVLKICYNLRLIVVFLFY